MSEVVAPMEVKTPLRICRICRLEAYTKEDLEQFVKHKTSRYGYQNRCLICHREDLKQRLYRTDEFLKIFKEGSSSDIIRCHFCEKRITKLRGKTSESLAIHSLDGKHENWEPNNKVPAHMTCHLKYHNLIRCGIRRAHAINIPIWDFEEAIRSEGWGNIDEAFNAWIDNAGLAPSRAQSPTYI